MSAAGREGAAGGGKGGGVGVWGRGRAPALSYSRCAQEAEGQRRVQFVPQLSSLWAHQVVWAQRLCPRTHICRTQPTTGMATVDVVGSAMRGPRGQFRPTMGSVMVRGACWPCVRVRLSRACQGVLGAVAWVCAIRRRHGCWCGAAIAAARRARHVWGCRAAMGWRLVRARGTRVIIRFAWGSLVPAPVPTAPRIRLSFRHTAPRRWTW